MRRWAAVVAAVALVGCGSEAAAPKDGQERFSADTPAGKVSFDRPSDFGAPKKEALAGAPGERYTATGPNTNGAAAVEQLLVRRDLHVSLETWQSVAQGQTLARIGFAARRVSLGDLDVPGAEDAQLGVYALTGATPGRLAIAYAKASNGTYLLLSASAPRGSKLDVAAQARTLRVE